MSQGVASQAIRRGPTNPHSVKDRPRVSGEQSVRGRQILRRDVVITGQNIQYEELPSMCRLDLRAQLLVVDLASSTADFICRVAWVGHGSPPSPHYSAPCCSRYA